MKTVFFIILIITCLTTVTAQTQQTNSGSMTFGYRELFMNNNSSKFNEYRDIKSGFYLQELKFDASNLFNSMYIDFAGYNLMLDDQKIRMRIGSSANLWKLVLINNKTPHRYSNKSVTQFNYKGDGVFRVADRVAIINDANPVTGTPSLVPTTPQMLNNDSLIVAYLRDRMNPYPLAVQRDKISAVLTIPMLGPIGIGLLYSDEKWNGNRLTYGTLGDRPPRTLNTQIPEPVQYNTREVMASAEFATQMFQGRLNYTFSMFENRINFMRWENVFFRPVNTLDYMLTVAGTPRNLSNFGQRALAPDNFMHNFSFTGGVSLPFNSRLNTTVSYGIMLQDNDLLPYSYASLGLDTALHGDGTAWNNLAKLPARSAEGKIISLRVDVDYTLNVFDRLNLRPHLRYYSLDNQTPIHEWRYVTQDASLPNGSAPTLNFRRNLAYGYDKLKYGIDAMYYIQFWRTSLMAGFSRESVKRDFREADTDENVIEARVRTKPINLISLSVNYIYGDRKSDSYNYKVVSQSYWYTFEEGRTETDNPQFIFADHPDLRRYDVADRKRNELNVTASLMPLQDMDLSVSYRNRNYDYNSDVTPVAPLLGSGLPLPVPADEFVTTPGIQLGLLKDVRNNIAASLNYLLFQKLNVFVFADFEDMKYDHRGLIFNEGLKNNPSNAGALTPTELGTWANASRIYSASIKQKTNTFGFGMGFELIPGSVNIAADYSLSLGKINLDYTGYTSDRGFLGRDWETFQFGFDDPPQIRYNQHMINASVEYRMVERILVGIHYMFSYYSIKDWMQEPEGPWVEKTGVENYWRDTSRDNRWGNRLINMGSTLAPGFEASLAYITLKVLF